jgi:broad specificity phosphatase PhoE
MVNVITVGECELEDKRRLTERGKNQIFELARSRIIAGVSTIYVDSTKASIESGSILSEELGARTAPRDCLDPVKVPGKYDEWRDHIIRMWEDEEFAPSKGESFTDAKLRFGSCMNDLVSKHKNDGIAIIVDPLIAILFDRHVTAQPLHMKDWLDMGYASCASYEYSRSWSMIMPHDNSFLSEPTSIKNNLPDDFI